MKVKDLIEVMGYGDIQIQNYDNDNFIDVCDCNDLPGSVLDCNVYEIASNIYQSKTNTWKTFIQVVLEEGECF